MPYGSIRAVAASRGTRAHRMRGIVEPAGRRRVGTVDDVVFGRRRRSSRDRRFRRPFGSTGCRQTSARGRSLGITQPRRLASPIALDLDGSAARGAARRAAPAWCRRSIRFAESPVAARTEVATITTAATASANGTPRAQTTKHPVEAVLDSIAAEAGCSRPTAEARAGGVHGRGRRPVHGAGHAIHKGGHLGSATPIGPSRERKALHVNALRGHRPRPRRSLGSKDLETPGPPC